MINESTYILLALILLTLVVAYLIKCNRRVRYRIRYDEIDKLDIRVEECGLVDDKKAKEILKLLNVQSIDDLKKYPADIYNWEIILKYFRLKSKRTIWSEDNTKGVSEEMKKILIESNSRPPEFIEVIRRSFDKAFLAGFSEIIRIDTSTKKQSKSGFIQS